MVSKLKDLNFLNVPFDMLILYVQVKKVCKIIKKSTFNCKTSNKKSRFNYKQEKRQIRKQILQLSQKSEINKIIQNNDKIHLKKLKKH